jgi:hypothetical protein
MPAPCAGAALSSLSSHYSEADYVRGFRLALSHAVASKAEMYGFPLVVWSSAAVQAHRFGVPDLVSALLFVLGALAAMAAVIAVASRGLTRCLPARQSVIRAFGGIHVVSVLGAILCGWGAARPIMRGSLAFFVASFVTVVVFESLLSLELLLSMVRTDKRG